MYEYKQLNRLNCSTVVIFEANTALRLQNVHIGYSLYSVLEYRVSVVEGACIEKISRRVHLRCIQQFTKDTEK